MGVQPYFVVVEKRVFWNTLVCNMLVVKKGILYHFRMARTS